MSVSHNLATFVDRKLRVPWHGSNMEVHSSNLLKPQSVVPQVFDFDSYPLVLVTLTVLLIAFHVIAFQVKCPCFVGHVDMFACYIWYSLLINTHTCWWYPSLKQKALLKAQTMFASFLVIMFHFVKGMYSHLNLLCTKWDALTSLNPFVRRAPLLTYHHLPLSLYIYRYIWRIMKGLCLCEQG